MRRLTCGALASAALCVGLLLFGGVEANAAPKPRVHIGVQLYSVRDDCAKNFPAVIAAIGKMGYEGVEFAGYYGYSAEDLRKMLDAAGLKCCGTHIGIDSLLGDNFMKTVEFNRTLGNKFLMVPGLPHERTDSRAAWIETARLFTEIAAKLKPYGMYVGYHNHTGEFKPLDGAIPFDTFFSNTSKDVVMEMDIGHVVHAGADPMVYLKKYPGRQLTVHVKEWDPNRLGSLIGEGTVQWKQVLPQLLHHGRTQWLIVEQEDYTMPPMESIEKDLTNLRGLLAQVR